MSAFRLWVRRCFALALFGFFISTFCFLWSFDFCPSAPAAGMIALCLTVLAGYLAWRAKDLCVAIGKLISGPAKAPVGRPE